MSTLQDELAMVMHGKAQLTELEITLKQALSVPSSTVAVVSAFYPRLSECYKQCVNWFIDQDVSVNENKTLRVIRLDNDSKVLFICHGFENLRGLSLDAATVI